MRIVFMGTPDFAVPSLKALVEGGYSVVGVVTQPDRPKGRGKKLAMSPVKEYAIQQGIPVLQPERISRDGYEDLLNLHPDLCVTAAFGQILSQKILDIPPLGTINVHASLLPKHRGSAPIAWAMVQGDKTTGVTTMMTARGIDNGDMLLKAETPIDPAETCGELTARLSEIGAKLLIETLKALENGTLERIPQDESQMTYDPKLEKDMGVIDWTQDAADIVHRIHGLNPWPGCTSAAPGGTWKLLRAEDKRVPEELIGERFELHGSAVGGRNVALISLLRAVLPALGKVEIAEQRRQRISDIVAHGGDELLILL